jgi:hypothetical protein
MERARQPGILEKALEKSVIGRWINYNANAAATQYLRPQII